MNQLIKALNDPTRRQILEMLKSQDLSAGDIAEAFEMTKPSISHHLDLLKQAGLVLAVKKGKYVMYSLNISVFEELIQWILSLTNENNE